MLLRLSTYTTSQQAWSSLCLLLPALMTLPGQSVPHQVRHQTRSWNNPHLRLSHTHSLLLAGQAEKGHSCLGFKPEGRGEGRASKKYCLVAECTAS